MTEREMFEHLMRKIVAAAIETSEQSEYGFCAAYALGFVSGACDAAAEKITEQDRGDVN